MNVREDGKNLQRVLSDIWPALSDNLMRPLVDGLERFGWRKVALIPSGVLGLLPLDSLRIDSAAFTLAPSARALKSSLTKLKHRAARAHFFSGVTGGSGNESDLFFSRIEVRESRVAFKKDASRIFSGNRAKSSAIREFIGRTSHLHFACHGIFNDRDPLDSGIALSNHEFLSLRDILSGALELSGVRLVVLSACRTGIFDIQNTPNEVVGLPAGFLQAGAPGVIGTLWPAPDVSTALLMIRFYRRCVAQDIAPAVALRAAKCWLRDAKGKDLADSCERFKYHSIRKNPDMYRIWRYFKKESGATPFSHPYYWAGFFFMGV